MWHIGHKLVITASSDDSSGFGFEKSLSQRCLMTRDYCGGFG
jgi:hypothetical protein